MGYAPCEPPRPFDGPRDDTTVAALRRVEISAASDLAGVRPYADGEIVAVELRREPGPDGRDALVAHRRDGAGRVGLVRPVQRYVMRAGLDRAARLHEEVVSRLDDPWGWVRISSADASGEAATVAITPPVLEQIPAQDREGDGVELLVCDGNHRVVQRAWRERQPLAAVAVLGALAVPYYAMPGSWAAWGETAGNVVDVSPPRAQKYRVRQLDPDELSEAARALLREVGLEPADWYRRWFRDFSTAFGSVGTQGGVIA